MVDIAASGITLTLSVPLLAGLGVAVLVHRLFLAALGPVRRALRAVDVDNSFRVEALRRELTAARATGEADRAARRDAEDRLRVVAAAETAARATRVAAEGRLAGARAQVRELDAAGDALRARLADSSAVPWPATGPVVAPNAPVDRTAVVQDVFRRVIPRLVAHEEADLRAAILDLASQRPVHLHRFVLPFEEIPLIVQALDDAQVEAFAAALTEMTSRLRAGAVQAVVTDPEISLADCAARLRDLGVTPGVDPEVEPALVTLARRYPPRELAHLHRRLREVMRLYAVPTRIEVASARSADLVRGLWSEIAGTAPMTVVIRPELVGGAILSDPLASLDASWVQLAPQIDIDENEGEQ